MSPLKLLDINYLIADSLKCPYAECLPLAQLIYRKTQGNPFFTNEFLQSLYTDKLLYFDSELGKWQWDINKIQTQDITDNVVELMVSKIQKLPSVTQQLLKFAAAIGDRFERKTLAVLARQTIVETNNNLQKATVLGLIFSLDDTIYKIVDLELLERLELECEYKFAHDKIQQAAYFLISEQDKPSVHWQIGEILLQNTSIAGLEQKIFDIVNQLNLGIKFIVRNPSKLI